MSDGRPSPPSRPRRAARTQEERSAETRAKVIAAAAECVADLGFKGATLSAIAQRAGVSWGAIQHQFGEKEAILDTVLEASLAEFEAGLAPLRETAAEPSVRVSAFGDLGVSAATLRRSRRYAFMVLSGIAAETMLFPGVDFSRQHLAELETNLVMMFAGGE